MLSLIFYKILLVKIVQKTFTIFISSTEELIGFCTIADFRVCQYPYTVVGVFFQIFHRQVLVIGFNDVRLLFVNVVGSDVKYFIASYFSVLAIDWRR